jgi:hypothetical protein
MLRHVETRIQFEALIGEDVGPMRTLAEFYGGTLNEERWMLMREERWNAGPGLFPAWPEWPTRLTREFWRICGDVMKRCGYSREEG